MCSAVAVTSTTTTPLLHLHTQNTHFIHTEPSTLRKLSLTLQTAQYVDALPLLLLTCTRNYKSGLTLRVITYLLKKALPVLSPLFFCLFWSALVFFLPLSCFFLPQSHDRVGTGPAQKQIKRNSKSLSTRFSMRHASLKRTTSSVAAQFEINRTCVLGILRRLEPFYYGC